MGGKRVVVLSLATLDRSTVGLIEALVGSVEGYHVDARVEADAAFDQSVGLDEVNDLKSKKAFVVNIGVAVADILVELAGARKLFVAARGGGGFVEVALGVTAHVLGSARPVLPQFNGTSVNVGHVGSKVVIVEVVDGTRIVGIMMEDLEIGNLSFGQLEAQPLRLLGTNHINDIVRTNGMLNGGHSEGRRIHVGHAGGKLNIVDCQEKLLRVGKGAEFLVEADDATPVGIVAGGTFRIEARVDGEVRSGGTEFGYHVVDSQPSLGDKDIV